MSAPPRGDGKWGGLAGSGGMGRKVDITCLIGRSGVVTHFGSARGCRPLTALAYGIHAKAFW